MSGDSPTSHANEAIFDFREGRSSPIPTTSKDPIPPHSIVTASVLIEPKKADEEKQDSAVLTSPVPKESKDEAIKEETLKLNDSSGCGNPPEKANGSDKLDGSWIPAHDEKAADKEDEECAVKCLYYTMQCCECTII